MLVFAAFANAAGMTGPVVQWQDWLSSLLGQTQALLAVTIFYVVAMLVLPLVLVTAVAALSKRWSAHPGSTTELACRFIYMLVPMGAAMWLTHYSFHLLTSAGTAIAATQRFLLDRGVTFLGEPAWSSCCAAPPADWLIRLEIVLLDLGLLLSLYTGYRIARDRHGLKAIIPWAGLVLLLFAVGIWIVLQPMEMRGTM